MPTASQLPWGVWQADLRTATEEQSRLTLADGGAAGNAFGGRGTDKRVEIPIPRAASIQDGLWLTVEGNDGSVHQQRFAIERLSPALARFIEEQP